MENIKSTSNMLSKKEFMNKIRENNYEIEEKKLISDWDSAKEVENSYGYKNTRKQAYITNKTKKNRINISKSKTYKKPNSTMQKNGYRSSYRKYSRSSLTSPLKNSADYRPFAMCIALVCISVIKFVDVPVFEKMEISLKENISKVIPFNDVIDYAKNLGSSTFKNNDEINTENTVNTENDNDTYNVSYDEVLPENVEENISYLPTDEELRENFISYKSMGNYEIEEGLFSEKK